MLQDSKQVIELKGKYKNSFVNKSDVIGRYIAKLKVLQHEVSPAELNNASNVMSMASSKQDNVLDEAYDYLHKLAGSSGMYGFDDIAKRCRKAMERRHEDSLDTVMKRLENIQKKLIKNADL